MTFTIRTATVDDIPRIEEVMRASMAGLGADFYDSKQTASAVQYIAIADRQLVEDGTYFVVIDQNVIVACGGWSGRRKLFTGTDDPSSGLRPPSPRKRGEGSEDQVPRPALRGEGGRRPGEGPRDLLDPSTDAARIRAMFVLPEYARKGIGRMILEAAEDDARKRGFTRFELMATLPGVPLYEACGYTREEEVPLQLPDGVTVGGVRMVK